MNQIKKTINHPTNRSRMIETFVGRLDNGVDASLVASIRQSITPDKLLFLSDHSARGQKSLGRIDQLRNRHRFKSR